MNDQKCIRSTPTSALNQFDANLEFYGISLVLMVYKNAFSGRSQTIPGDDSELNSGGHDSIHVQVMLDPKSAQSSIEL